MTLKAVAAALAFSLALAGGNSAAQGKGEEHKDSKTERHGWLGVSIMDVTPRLAREKDLHVKSGALVNGVTEEGPADESGIKEDDVIVGFNGKTVDESDDLQSAVRDASPGDKGTVTLYRGAEKKSLQVTLGKAPRRGSSYSFHGPGHISVPPIPPVPSLPRIHMFRSEGTLGLSLNDLNRQLGEYFGAPGGRGVLVEKVERKSEGERAGFKAGDVIIKAGRDDVETTEDIMEAMDGGKKGDKVEFGVLRKGEHVTLTAESEGPQEHRWRDLRSFEPENFKMDMQKLKEELRLIGTKIRSGILGLENKLRSVTS